MISDFKKTKPKINSTKSVDIFNLVCYNTQRRERCFKMLTEFGRILRKIRIDCNEILKDMAEKLNVSAAYLSAVEMGKRNIPELWVDKIVEFYNLSEDEKTTLRNAADNSSKSITLNFENVDKVQKETAILFAREFENVDIETLNKIKNLLRNT